MHPTRFYGSGFWLLRIRRTHVIELQPDPLVVASSGYSPWCGEQPSSSGPPYHLSVYILRIALHTLYKHPAEQKTALRRDKSGRSTLLHDAASTLHHGKGCEGRRGAGKEIDRVTDVFSWQDELNQTRLHWCLGLFSGTHFARRVSSACHSQCASASLLLRRKVESRLSTGIIVARMLGAPALFATSSVHSLVKSIIKSSG